MKKVLFAIMILSMLLLSGCMVSQEKYDSLQTNLNSIGLAKDQLTTENNNLQSQVIAIQKDLDDEKIKSNIKNDYIELYQYLVAASYLEGALTHQYDLWYNNYEIYTDIYKENLIVYKAQIQTTKDKVNRLIEKLSQNPDLIIKGLPEELDTISELEDLKAGMDAGIEILEAELHEMN